MAMTRDEIWKTIDDGSRVSSRFDLLGRDDAKRIYRLGIMGGTFNPIHFGHLVCAEQAREKFGLDAVIFIPTAHPAGKDNSVLLSATDRICMVWLAIQDNPYFDVSQIEHRRSGITYTVETLSELRAFYPDNVLLYFITGSDSVMNLNSWHGAREMVGLATFIGATRPGYDLEVARRSNALSQNDLHIEYIDIPALAISSTDLRARLTQGRSIRYLTPDPVISFIEENHHYRIGGR